MSISRLKLYAAGEPFGASCTRIDGGRLILGAGGGGGSKQIDQRYAGLDALYAEQTASARLLRGQAEKYLPAATDNYAKRVEAVVGEGYKERQADTAGADIASANAAEREATERSLTSMGVNPNDARFVGSARSTEVSNAARMAAGKNAARDDAEKYQLAVSQDAVGTFTGQSNSAASQMAGASNGMAGVAGQQAQTEANKQAQRSQNVSNAVGGAMAAWSMFKDGGKVRPSYGVTRLVKRANGGAVDAGGEPKMLERHAMGDMAGSQQKTQHGFFQMNQITPPPVVQQPARPQQQGPSPMDYAKAAGKAKQDGSISDRMAARGAENTDKMGRLASHVSEDAGNQISSNAAGQRMAGSPDQARAASDAYRAAAAEAKDAAAAQTYETTAANIDAGAGIEAASASTPAATTGATAAAEGGLAATAPGVAGEVGAMASGAGAAGSAGAAAGTTAATTSALGAAAPGVSSAVGAAASGAGAAGASTAAATTAATTAASTGLGTAAAAIGTAMPWIGAAMVVGSLLGAWKDGGAINESGGDFSREFARDADSTQDLRDGAAVEGPGGHTDDIVPALLSNGEGVLNGEAMALGGEQVMEELNKKGLELRKQGVTPDEIRSRGYGLSKLKRKEVA